MGDAIVWSASITSKAAGWWRIDQMKSFGNLILMTLICVVIFIVFLAVRPAPAHAEQVDVLDAQTLAAGIPPECLT
jgi:hypothetical protein